MAERITRRQMKHDKFVDDVNVAYSYMQGHRRNLLLALGALVLAGIVAYGLWAWKGVKERKAQARLGEAIMILSTPVTPAPAPGEKQGGYRTEEEKTTKAAPILEEVAKNYPSTDAADVAGLYLARLAAARGDLANTKPKLELFVREHPDHVLAAGAQLSLYELELTSGNAKTLAPVLEQKLTEEKKILPADVLLSLLAQAYESMGDRGKARDTYQRIVTEFPDSPYAIDAQRNLPAV